MSDSNLKSKYSADFLNKLLFDMLQIRRFEEKAAQMYGLQKIGGFLHLYIGEEAVAVGSIATLNLREDYVVAGYRDHGHALACGSSADSLMAELYGKSTGCSKGKGGSMHFFDAEKHMMGGNGIVGGQIPLATGIAFKIKYNADKKNEKRREGEKIPNPGVVLCYFGDGAIHQGAFHESLNLAKIWHLPIVYICENNQYGMGTDFRRVSSVHDLSSMGSSYGIPGKQVNGMDVLEVYEEVSVAVKRAKEEGLPSLLEILTYRYKGHSMSDPGKYRTREELEEYKKQDPILILKEKMTAENLLTEEQYREIDKKCKEIAQKSVEFAEKSPAPPLSSLYEDILV